MGGYEIKYSVCPRPFMRPKEAQEGKTGKGRVRDGGTGKGQVRDQKGRDGELEN